MQVPRRKKTHGFEGVHHQLCPKEQATNETQLAQVLPGGTLSLTLKARHVNSKAEPHLYLCWPSQFTLTSAQSTVPNLITFGLTFGLAVRVRQLIFEMPNGFSAQVNCSEGPGKWSNNRVESIYSQYIRPGMTGYRADSTVSWSVVTFYMKIKLFTGKGTAEIWTKFLLQRGSLHNNNDSCNISNCELKNTTSCEHGHCADPNVSCSVEMFRTSNSAMS